MEGHCSTGQSPKWAVVPMEEEEEYVKIMFILHRKHGVLLLERAVDECCVGLVAVCFKNHRTI